MGSLQRIRPNSVLPARRQPLTLTTADGLRLIGELAVPSSGEPVATMICLHPLPTQGGMMDSQIFRKAAARLPALAQIAVLRFNTRGTTSVQGTSEGAFEDGVGERLDVEAAVAYAERAELPRRWLVGWSFGTELALLHGLNTSVEGVILLSPPLRRVADGELAPWAESQKRLVAIVPEYDDYLRPDEARRRFAVVPEADVVDVPGGRHLWVGQAETVLNLIVERLNPLAAPLPTTWGGEMEHADIGFRASR
ncbi:MAG: alpha/beta hydrolase [Nocardioidaceae bacterium]